jgi:hypothetical protein
MRATYFGLSVLLLGCFEGNAPSAPDRSAPVHQPPVAVTTRPARKYDIHADSTGTLRGEVSLQTAGDGKVLVLAVDTVPTDGAADRFFTLQSETSFPAVSSRHAAGMVQYQNGRVDVVMPAGMLAF